MYTRENIQEQLTAILTELFEIEPNDITLSANLYEDLDIDSIDAIDIMVKLKELTGKKIQPAKFKDVRTVGDVVEAVYAIVNAEEAEVNNAG
jgi:acyl carrier protein